MTKPVELAPERREAYQPGPPRGTQFLFYVEIKDYYQDFEGNDVAVLRVFPHDTIVHARRGEPVNLALQVWEEV